MSPAEAAIREALPLITEDDRKRWNRLCSPMTIGALLSELDALRARCESAEALLRGIVSTFGKTGDIPLASIDAHLKGAGQ